FTAALRPCLVCRPKGHAALSGPVRVPAPERRGHSAAERCKPDQSAYDSDGRDLRIRAEPRGRELLHRRRIAGDPGRDSRRAAAACGLLPRAIRWPLAKPQGHRHRADLQWHRRNEDQGVLEGLAYGKGLVGSEYALAGFHPTIAAGTHVEGRFNPAL